MKAFLFLYPLVEYIEDCNKYLKKDVNYLNEIIAARYRDTGYKVFWLAFSVPGANKSIPDRFSKKIFVAPTDEVISCGISWWDFQNDTLRPNQHYILDQLPANLSKLVLGGFHQFDCVDLLASIAWKRKLDVFVDEDTTHMFFSRLSIPLIRTEWNLEALGYRGKGLDQTQVLREGKPWFTQTES